ncbi:MAG: glycosyltransferase family 4 protein [Deltaproteobacteria bacterium]|nr:glycosyltransferase family 4 protein [Deltaproteobacteria bacterium]
MLPTGEGPLLVFDTHPIQYRSPVFRGLYKKLPSLKVYYFNDRFDGKKWWFHEVDKIPPQTWNLPLREGFPNEVLESEKFGLLKFHRTIDCILKKDKPSAILIYGYYLREHWILLWAARRKHIPVLFVGETFSQGSSSSRKILKRFLQPLFFSNVARFIAIGNKNIEFYTSLKIPTEKIQPARYCIDTTFFELTAAQASHSRQQTRLALNIPSNGVVILFIGRLFERKRPLDMVQLHETLADDSNVHTVIVGNGPLEEELKKVSHPRFHVAGFKNQQQVRDLYYASDCLVVPSEFETWGLVVNEAFACGLPAIVTDTCGVAGDLVVHGETGFVYPVGQIHELANHARKLVWDKHLGKEMGEKAHGKVISEYNVEQFVDAVVSATIGSRSK